MSFDICTKKDIMNIPIYKAQINETDEGITAISFVREPAVETCFLQFAKQTQTQFKTKQN